jgi:serine-type D-Ala-D-Ala carboxypeptidase (penicillin-binding protein 5/6)
MIGGKWLCVVGAVVVLSSSIAVARSEPKTPAPQEPPYRAAILVEAESGTVLFEENADLKGPPASMTKMMLILLIAERVRDGSMHWDDPIMASAHASRIGGSQVYLREGEVFPLSEMMQAIVIHSANDASVAVAEAVAGSAEAFVELMNQRAQELGMHNTIYRSVHGLPPEQGQEPDISTPRDLGILARELVKFPEVIQWSGTREAPFRQGAMTLTNTNRLVRETNWVDGLKTGYYSEAGFNVTATGKRNDLRMIAVVMGAKEKKQCFGQASRLLSEGLAKYQKLVAVKQGDVVAVDVRVKGGKPRFIRVLAGDSLSVLAKRGEKRSFKLQLGLFEDLHPPLRANAPVGQVIVQEGETEIGRVPAVAGEAVEEGAFWERFF